MAQPDYTSMYLASGRRWNVDPNVLRAIANVESAEDPNVKDSSAGAQGFMQFMPDTAKQYGVNVRDVPSSIDGAAHYMSDLLDQNQGNLPVALAQYNGSRGDQSQIYARQILAAYNGLPRISAPAQAASAPTPAPPAPAPAAPSDSAAIISQLGGGTAPAPATPTITVRPTQDASTQPPAPMSSKDIISSLSAPTPDTAAPAQPAQAAQNIDPITGRPFQYATAGTPTPVGATTGQPIAEGQQPGAVAQAKINLATDPEQRRRIAAATLFPNLSPTEAQSRLFYGPDNRLAAVDPSGNAYFVDPQQVFTGSLLSPDINPFASRPNVAPYAPGSFAPGNLLTAAAAEAPNALQTGAVAVGQQIGGPLGAGAASAVSDLARARLAQAYDPAGRLVIDPSQVGLNALFNAGLTALPGMFSSGERPPVTPSAPVAPSAPPPPARPLFGASAPALPSDFTTAPFAPGYVPPGSPGAPVSAVPGLASPEEAAAARAIASGAAPAPPITRPGAAPPPPRPGAPGPRADVQLNPAGEAAAPSGPYAPTSPVEAATIPDALPPMRFGVFTQAQANARADDIIRHFAANGPTVPDTRTLLPGSEGTLAQITGNAGLATLERAVRNVPDVTNIFAGVDAAQQNARQAFTARLIGTPDDLDALKAARAASTSDLRNAAFDPANTTPTDASGAVAEIDRVLNSPAGKRTGIAEPLQRLRDSFYTTDPATGLSVLESDPEMLYGVRQNITDSLGPMAGRTAPDARAAASLLQPVLSKLDTAIEAGAPGYQNYMRAFADQSGPINAMEYLQSRGLTDANGNPTLVKVDSTLKDIQRQQARPGAQNADALTDDQIAQLQDLRDDLRRQANLAKGKALGSNTVQNFAAGQATNMLTRPIPQLVGRAVGAVVGGLPGYFAASGAENLLTGATQSGEAKVRQALVDRLLNRNGLGVRALQPNTGGAASASGTLSGTP